MRGLVRAAVFVFTAAVTPGMGAPFIPESDNQVLEHLPLTPNDPAMRKLRALRDQLKDQPDNLPLAVRLARGYLELGRVTGDPRYAGYAQAALSPWWDLKQPPEQILVLRATLRQRIHQFDTALVDLGAVLAANPSNAQARLTRATVLQVQGAFDAARNECLALQDLTQELVWTACLTSVNGTTGKLRESYEQLRAALGRQHHVKPEVRSWVLTSLAEMAARAGMAEDAQGHFRGALALDAAACPRVPDELQVIYRLFFDIDPQHKGLLRLEAGGETRTAIFSPETAQQTFKLARQSHWKQFLDYLATGVEHIWKGYDHILLPDTTKRRRQRGTARNAFNYPSSTPR